uniref:type II secretion system protein GspL n=1 Tax=Thaumasiovibrio occultus TaxID=1891184 RepID=UPI000B34AC98|nr:type II secretion system protein GspL [Thaumasiovibrio occultus]
MSEFLTVRLSNDLSAPVPWLVWSPTQQEVIASGTLSSGDDLHELSDYGAQRQVVALIDSAALLLAPVTLPKGSLRQLERVLPYLLEEELAQDVEDMHVHLLGRQGDQGYVAAVEHALVERWLAQLADANLPVRRLVPDCLCLPLRDEVITAAELGDQWLLRFSEHLGAAVDTAWLDFCLEEDSQIHHYTPAPEGVKGQWQTQTPELVMQLLTMGALDNTVNLLSGPYRRQPSWQKHLLPWRKVAIAAGVVLAVSMIGNVVQVNRVEKQVEALKAYNKQVFNVAFPGAQRIPTNSWARSQVNAELKRLGSGQGGAGLLGWLAELEPILKDVSSFEIMNLRYDAGRSELRLQAQANDFAPFEQVRGALAKQYEVEQGQLSRRDEKVQGMFTLRRKS